jgi:hypothetical protein
MAQHVRIRTARLFQSIRKDREPAIIQCVSRQISFFVGSLGETNHKAFVPGLPTRFNMG